MHAYCPYSPMYGTGWLEGWRLTFAGEVELGWEGAVCTIVESPGDRVFVAVYDVHPRDAEQLDEVEGVTAGTYRKLHLRVATLDGDVTAWVYVFNGYEGGLPTAWYLTEIAAAAEKAGAPADLGREQGLRWGETAGGDGGQVRAGPVLPQELGHDGGPRARPVLGHRHGAPGREQREPGGIRGQHHPLGQIDQPVHAGEQVQPFPAPPAALGEMVGGDLAGRDDPAGGVPAVPHGVGRDEPERRGDRVRPHLAERTAAPRDVERPAGQAELAGPAQGLRVLGEGAAELVDGGAGGGSGQ